MEQSNQKTGDDFLGRKLEYTFVGVVFIGIAFLGLWLVHSLSLPDKNTRAWRENSCRIVQSQASATDMGYYFTAKYEYSVDGRVYTSTRYSREKTRFENIAEVDALAQKYPAGVQRSCYVNPKNHSEAVLSRDGWAYLYWYLIPLVFFLGGFSCIYTAWLGKISRGPIPRTTAPFFLK